MTTVDQVFIEVEIIGEGLRHISFKDIDYARVSLQFPTGTELAQLLLRRVQEDEVVEVHMYDDYKGAWTETEDEAQPGDAVWHVVSY